MSAIKTVLVPLDGSPLAERVLPYVVEIARRAGAEVILMTAVVPLATWDPAAAGVKWDREEESARRYLEERAEKLSRGGLRVRVRSMWGDAAECIARLAVDERADLVAMTTHGRSGIARWALGSVASKVSHGSVAPLLLVRADTEEAPAAEEPDIQRILLPVDGSELSEAAVPFVAEFAAVLGASLVVHHAVTPPAMLYPGVEMSPLDDRLATEIQAAAREMAERAAAQARARDVSAETAVTTGFPVDEIVRVAEQRQADLIAMSTHGRSGLGRWVMGSVADAVLRRTTLPCLLVRPQALKGARDEARAEERRDAGERAG